MKDLSLTLGAAPFHRLLAIILLLLPGLTLAQVTSFCTPDGSVGYRLEHPYRQILASPTTRQGKHPIHTRLISTLYLDFYPEPDELIPSHASSGPPAIQMHFWPLSGEHEHLSAHQPLAQLCSADGEPPAPGLVSATRCQTLDGYYFLKLQPGEIDENSAWLRGKVILADLSSLSFQVKEQWPVATPAGCN